MNFVCCRLTVFSFLRQHKPYIRARNIPISNIATNAKATKVIVIENGGDVNTGIVDFSNDALTVDFSDDIAPNVGLSDVVPVVESVDVVSSDFFHFVGIGKK